MDLAQEGLYVTKWMMWYGELFNKNNEVFASYKVVPHT